MSDFSQLLQQGAANAWLFLPTAVVLGALHGLEPGHSKTMMAAFIIAIRGSVAQAALLGVSAAISHSLVIWILAAVALQLGSRWNAESTEPYFQIASAVIVAALAIWMFWRTRHDVKAAAAHSRGHDHDHDHAHVHGGTADYEDAHERAHAMEIQQRFASRKVTTAQIVLFGLTGGLIPCPAAFSILIICLQVKHFTLGVSMVLAFSIGLALTLVATGSIAAWSVRRAEKRFKGFGNMARRLPYLSSAFLVLVAMYMGVTGWRGLTLMH
jgi:nickel/cobalt exporter